MQSQSLNILYVCPELNNKNIYGSAHVVNQINIHAKQFNLYILKKKNFYYLINKIKIFNVIHLHGCWHIYHLIFFILSKIFKIKVVFSPHGMLDKNSFNIKFFKKKIAYYLYQKYIIKYSDLIIVNSKNEKKTIKKFKLNSEIAVINHGISIRNFFVNSFSNLNFVFFSKIHPIKNLHQLIIQWTNSKILKKYKLDIYGSIDDKKYFSLITNLLKLNKNIQYKGILKGENKFRILSKYNVFIHPSLSENFGLVILEALSCGLYIIYNKILPWKILENHNFGCGINFNLNNLERAIIKLEKNKKKIVIKKRRKKIYELLKKKYNWVSIVKKYDFAYEKLFSCN